MSEEEKIYRGKILKIGASSIGICLLIAYWYATQAVAAEYNYHPFLGGFFEIFGVKIYAPYKFYVWQHNELMVKMIPQTFQKYGMIPYVAAAIGAGFTYLCSKGLKKETSHGSAAFATAKEIDEAGLGQYEGKHEVKKSGVVVGVNPYTKKLMLHNGVEHILLVAPTRSGKGVNTIIPTGLVWRNSIFFFDVKGELWQATSGYRQKVLKQKVMKFEPLCGDGSSARWNPLAEINFQTAEELGDVSTIVSIMVKPDGEKQGGGDPFWDNAASALLSGVIMHLMYKHHKENLRLPCPTDIMSFLSSPDKNLDELFTDMKNYPHISPEEFLSGENPLKEIYGEYILNLKPFTDALGKTVRNLEEIRQELLKIGAENINWDAPPPPKPKDNLADSQLEPNAKTDTDTDTTASPFYMLLVHPKVAECAANMLNGAEQTRASIMQTAQTAMALYQNPVVQKNTEVSDFCIQDLLSPKDTVSLYLCMNSNEVATLKPLSRLLINTMLQKLIREIKFDSSGGAKMKQRLLLMLDEFPQLGNLKSVELALAVCAGYGIKVCIVAQDINQLNKEYTKDNSIGSNCHIHIYFTPNLDSGGATAESISKNLGKQTIKTISHSDGGGLGKGSNTENSTGRELMTADEVSHMSSERELVFVAGHRPIYGNKLRYYLQPFFLERLKKYQEIYVKEHNFDFCKKYPKGDGKACAACMKIKAEKNLPQIECPTYPLYSDSVTKVLTYENLFEVHAADKKAAEEKAEVVREEKFPLSTFVKKVQVEKENIKIEKAKFAAEKTKELRKEDSPVPDIFEEVNLSEEVEKEKKGD